MHFGDLHSLVPFIFVFVVTSASPLTSPCRIRPERTGLTVLECRDSTDRMQLAKAINSSINVQELHLDGAVLDWLPGDALTSSPTTRLRLTRSQLMSDLVRPSGQMWPSLQELEIESVDVEQGRNLNLGALIRGATELRTLYLRDVAVPVLDGNFRRDVTSKLQFLELKGTGTITVEEESLELLQDLLYLSITGTPLSKVPRKALPETMKNLHTLILSNNRISELEADFFHGMLKLKVLMIGGNDFKTLGAATFQSIGTHLRHLVADDNPIVCDCSLQWLFSPKNTVQERGWQVLATCRDPQSSKLTDITDLNVEALCRTDDES